MTPALPDRTGAVPPRRGGIALDARRSGRILAAVVLALLTLLHATVASAQSGGFERVDRNIRVDGLNRSYSLFLPRGADTGREWPLIVGFHPAFAQAVWMEREAGFQTARGAGNYVIAYPDGIRRAWNAGDCCGAPYRRNIDDIAFFRAMMRDIETIVPVDDVYLTGFSNGARMVYHILCRSPQGITAAAPVGATRDMSDCAASRVPILHIHGTEDDASPAMGGTLSGLGEGIGYISPAPEVVGAVARRNGCGQAPTRVDLGPALGTSCDAYCPGSGSEAVLCLIEGLGHNWPGTSQGMKMFGPFRPDVDATAAVLQFFARH